MPILRFDACHAAREARGGCIAARRHMHMFYVYARYALRRSCLFYARLATHDRCCCSAEALLFERCCRSRDAAADYFVVAVPMLLRTRYFTFAEAPLSASLPQTAPRAAARRWRAELLLPARRECHALPDMTPRSAPIVYRCY